VAAVVVAAGADVNPARRVVLSLILFGIAFGFVEAAVVVYLRQLSAPLRAQAGLPDGQLFPLLSLQEGPPFLDLLRIELVREAATLTMLAAIALAVAREGRSWLGAFSVTFGVWDLTFYGWLWVMLRWPPSLETWDLLFLLPVPWAAPVLAPAIVAATMTVGGALLLVNRRVVKRWLGGMAAILAGSAVLVVSFTWDWRYWMGGGVPRSFPWAIFAAGELLIILGFLALLGGLRIRQIGAA
jgi:hypothetical protein